jgi:hypothetical protein
LSATVAVVVVPAFTLVWARVTVATAGAVVTTRVAVLLVDDSVAVIVGLPAEAMVVTVKVAVVEPAGTITLAGTVALPVTELLSDTVVPPEGAVPVSVTVPVGWTAPPRAEGASRTRVERAGAVMVRLAVFVTPE